MNRCIICRASNGREDTPQERGIYICEKCQEKRVPTPEEYAQYVNGWNDAITWFHHMIKNKYLKDEMALYQIVQQGNNFPLKVRDLKQKSDKT